MKIAKIAELCIHLRKDRATVVVNPETHLRVLFGNSIFNQASGSPINQDLINHYRLFWDDVATQLGVNLADILDFDLCFADAYPSAIVGMSQEFISGPRLDNLFSTWSAIVSLLRHQTDKDSNINIAALFDHEEIGSETITGANSRTFSLTKNSCRT